MPRGTLPDILLFIYCTLHCSVAIVLVTTGIATETEAGEMLGDARVETDTLTELRGSLFLSDEYGQAYFQPWN